MAAKNEVKLLYNKMPSTQGKRNRLEMVGNLLIVIPLIGFPFYCWYVRQGTIALFWMVLIMNVLFSIFHCRHVHTYGYLGNKNNWKTYATYDLILLSCVIIPIVLLSFGGKLTMELVLMLAIGGLPAFGLFYFLSEVCVDFNAIICIIIVAVGVAGGIFGFHIGSKIGPAIGRFFSTYMLHQGMALLVWAVSGVALYLEKAKAKEKKANE